MQSLSDSALRSDFAVARRLIDGFVDGAGDAADEFDAAEVAR